jgi:hypothetical protein
VIVSGDVEHGRAVAKDAGTFFNPECDRVIANVKDGRLLGGVIFTGYQVASMGLHAASWDPHWFDRDMLWITFHYPFVQLGVSKIFVTIPMSNRKSISFCSKLGFVEEARLAEAFPDCDLSIMSMRKEHCRWLKRGSRGKQEQRAAAARSDATGECFGRGVADAVQAGIGPATVGEGPI